MNEPTNIHGKALMARPDELDRPIVKKMIVFYSRVNLWLFRATGGLLGNKWRIGAGFPWGAPVALLTTIGRKSGQPRTTPLIFGQDGEKIVFVGSQGGLPKNPLWCLNIEKTPEVEVQVRRERKRYLAHFATGDERARVWQLMCEVYADYDQYQHWTDREIPVAVCVPVAD